MTASADTPDNPQPSVIERFTQSYEGDPPPWDIGKPQDAFLQYLAKNDIAGPVIDVGCGTGELSLHVASLGHKVTGIDPVPKAIAAATEKATQRKVAVAFRVADALNPPEGLGTFKTLLDCGVFHIFNDQERALYVQSLTSLAAPGAKLFLLCFSDAETREGGPRRIAKDKLQAAFAQGWRVISIEAATFENTHHEGGSRAWFALLERRGKA